ncbi:PhzF family phenazine biosynthesis protein [Tsuneonella sp. HG222]
MLSFRIVDAFAARPMAGNQAAVVQLEQPLLDAAMQAIAAELCLPATAFVRAADGGAADVAWFSPTGEIRLCGHGALAAADTLLPPSPGEALTLRTRHGVPIEARRAADGQAEIAMPAIPVERGEWPEAAAMLGGDPQEVWRNPGRYNVFVYRSEGEIRALAPDLAGLAALGDHQIACTAPGTATDIVSRVFTGAGGGREDAATGSAHAVLAPLWAARLGRGDLTAHQTSARGGDLTCRLEGDRVWLGGRCHLVAEGRLYSSG